MKRFVFLFMFLLFVGVSVCHAQTRDVAFVGGEDALRGYLSRNINYPESSRNKNSQGQVSLGLTIGRDGSVCDVKLLKSSGDESLDNEAVRVANMMPKWSPAYEDGTPIRSYFMLSVVFELQPDVWYDEFRYSQSTDAPKGEFRMVSHAKKSEGYDSDYAEEEVEEEAIEMTPDKKAEFPGGFQAMYKFLSKNIKYPAVSLNSGSQGTTTLRFVVEKDGIISRVEILKSSGDPYLDKEAIRVLGTMPKWSPGERQGMPVRSYFVLPVKFTINDEAPKRPNR